MLVVDSLHVTWTASGFNAFPIMQYCAVWARTTLKSHRATSWSGVTQIFTCFWARCFAGSVFKAIFSLARTLNCCIKKMKQRNVKSTAPAVLQSVDEDGVQKGTMAKLTSPDYSSNTPDLERFSPLPIFYG